MTIKDKTSNLAIGKSFRFSAAVYSTSNSNYDSSRVTWSVANKMGKATINSSTGVLTGVSQGSVIVTAKFRYGYGTEYTENQKVIINGSAPINDGGVYFIYNRSNSNLYLSDNNDSNNKLLYAQYSNNKSRPKWIFSKDSEGYYSIKLVDDQYNNYYITVPSGSETASGSELTLSGFTASSRQKWRITQLSNGAFTISAKSSESYPNGDLVISLPSSGTKLQQCEYTNNTDYKDEWVFVPYSIMFYGIPAGEGHDHVTSISGAKSKLETKGFSNITIKAETVSSSDCLEDLLNANIFTFRGHGGAHYYENTSELQATTIVTEATVEDQSFEGVYKLSSHYLGDSEPKADWLCDYDFSNLDLAVFVGCETGKGGEHANNLPSRIVALGARVAIGFNITIECDDAEAWTNNFYNNLLFNGKTVYEAAISACDNLEYITPNDVVVCGDKDFEIPHK